MSGRTFDKVLQAVTAGSGFFVGYVWAVMRWSGEAEALRSALVRSSLGAGVGVSLLYCALLLGLFWSWLPVPRARGLRVAVSPAAFTLSLLAGFLGIHGALCLLG